MEKQNKYPIGGFAPGYYSCKCASCKILFQGDKRAVQCKPCAIKETTFPKENVIDSWLEKNGDPEITKQVEEEALDLEFKRVFENFMDNNFNGQLTKGLVLGAMRFGANWQAERMYTESEVWDILLKVWKATGNLKSTEYRLIEPFEQFKK